MGNLPPISIYRGPSVARCLHNANKKLKSAVHHGDPERIAYCKEIVGFYERKLQEQDDD